MAYIPSKCSISDYEQVVYNGETKNKLYISFGGNELIDADYYCEKLTIKSRLLKNGNNYFSLDNFVSKEATLILHKVEIGKIKDPVIIELGTYIDKVQDYVYVPFGVFNIQGTPTNDKDKTTITLRDNSVKFDFDYNAKNEIDRNGGSATLYQILQDICKQAKVNCTIPSTLTGIDDKTGLYDNTIKARTYVSYIAEHCGKIATIDRNGYLIFVDLIGDAINVSGNNISIDNAIERPIETIQIDGKSTQETRSGKNLLKNIGVSNTSNGITFTVNDDKTILANGNNDGTANSRFIINNYSLKAGTYILNGCPSGGSSTTYRIGIQKTSDWSVLGLDTGSGSKQFTIDEATTVQVAIFIQKGQTISNLLFKSMIRLSSVIDDTYEQYGVMPSPDYPSEVECVKGKNLFDKNSSETQIGYFTSDGTVKTGGSSTITITYTKIVPNLDMTISGINLEWLCFYDKNKNFIERIAGASNLTSNTFNKNASYIRFQASTSVFDLDKIQLEKGKVATSYLPYGTVQVKDVGKNLYDLKIDWKFSVTSYNISKNKLVVGTGGSLPTTGVETYLDYLKPNTTYTLSYKASSTNNTQGVIIGTGKNTGSITALYSSYSSGNAQITFKTPDDTSDLIIWFYGIRGAYYENASSTYEDIQLEKGIQATEYEPYQENTLNIDLQGNELCSLPNGVKDELIIENGRAKIIKRIGKYNITGNEVWALSGTESQPYINFSNYVDNCKYPATTTELPNLLSNYYLQITRNNLYDGRITLSPGKALIIYDTVHNTSLANFKEWLKSASVVVYYQLATEQEIDLGEVDTLSTFKGVNNVSLVANMQTNMNLQYYKSKKTYTVPLNIVQSYEDGEDFKLSQVKYESGELYWNKGDNKNDALYINSANPYITNQKNIDNIYNIVNGLEINSLKLKKQRGNPLLDCYDFIEIQTDNSNGLVKSGLFKSGIMKSMSPNATTYKTLAQNELIYNGKIMQTFDTTITKQAKNTNVSKNNEASLKKYVKSEINGVKGELTTVVGKVDTIDVKTNNNYQEILNMFDEYTPQSDFLELENNVTRIQTDTYTKTEINQKLTNGSVTKVLTTAGTFDNNGLTIEKTNAKTKGNFNEKGMTIKDATGSTDTELLFAGYDDILNETIVRTKNIKVEKYLTIGKNSRIEDYSTGTGVFHIGE